MAFPDYLQPNPQEHGCLPELSRGGKALLRSSAANAGRRGRVVNPVGEGESVGGAGCPRFFRTQLNSPDSA